MSESFNHNHTRAPDCSMRIDPLLGFDCSTEMDALLTSREKLLSNIAQLVAKFVHDVSIKQGLSEKVASEAGGRIYTSGSYRCVLNFSTSSFHGGLAIVRRGACVGPGLAPRHRVDTHSIPTRRQRHRATLKTPQRRFSDMSRIPLRLDALRLANADGRLGVHGPGSDIDTICVCPRHIYREHFFGEFKQMLKEWPAVTEISVCRAVTEFKSRS